MKEISKGYIALFRQFMDWEWYDDANTMRLFIHCLLCANHETNKWRGKIIERGQFITSQSKLANRLKLSIKQIRGSLNKLKMTGELAVLTSPEYSIITVKNYDYYQGEGRQKDSQMSQKGQTKGRRRATNNNENNISNISYINISLSDKKITNDEREILKNYILRQKRKPDNIDAYMKAIIKNGDWVSIVETEKKRLQIKEEKKKKQEELEQEIIEEDNLTPEEEALKIAEIQKKIRENRLKRRKN